jgi:nitroreductase
VLTGVNRYGTQAQREEWNSKLEQAFDLPENEKAVLIMPIGYPAEGVAPAPAHTESKKLEEIVRHI